LVLKRWPFYFLLFPSLGEWTEWWPKVYTSISEGGLGVRNLHMFNCALLGKLLCAMCMKKRLGEELWWTLNLAIHAVGGVLMSLMGIWGAIMEKY
jgi:hypothetical protein